ncbi:MAG: tRNA uridine-5-carboxymethylaminomethyl(34) synthesis GTPase MnmE, partial [Pseudomonadota bacterium]
ADHALLLVDATDAALLEQARRLSDMLPDNVEATLVVNKVDLARVDVTSFAESLSIPVLQISAITGDGLPDLRDHLRSIAGLSQDHDGAFSARRRHVVALTEARDAFERGVSQLLDHRAGELMAEELRLCQESLTAITGAFTSDDLLGKIFGEFCIGK